MDNFMDKIAQKLSAQEAIRANAAADAAQIEKLESQVAEYDACMKEMRKLNLKNAENEQKLNDLLVRTGGQIEDSLNNYSRQLESLTQRNAAQIQKLAEEAILKIRGTKSEAEKDEDVKQSIEELRKTAGSNMEKLQELFSNSDEFVHKENVKVYRNVQAAVVEELEKQTQALLSARDELVENISAQENRNKKAFIINIITLTAVAVNLGLLIAHLAGLL